MTVVAALLGAGVALGICLLVSGLRPADAGLEAETPTLRPDLALVRRRLALTVGFAAPVALLTRWPVAAMALATLGWCSPELFGSKAARERDVERTEAIAGWTEMLRDTIAGAHGIEEAVVTTAAVAPRPIATEVRTLALRTEREPLSVALRGFAGDLSHPTGDLVVASLSLASQGAVGDLGELLSTLAVAARDEAGMRLRVEAARARLRTAVRVIAGCTATTAVGLLLLNRSYVSVYGTGAGQVVLLMVAGLWGASLWWMSRMGRFIAPDRFLAGEATPRRVRA